MTLPPVVALALAEDLGEAGDLTSAATVPADLRVMAGVVAREGGVAAGLDAAAAVFATDDMAVTPRCTDGEHFGAGTVLMEIEGSARSILAAERTALNLLCHLCGVATLTARYVAEVQGTGVLIRDTRKTLPGMRALQKAAVMAGGGRNHRAGLYDGLLVKDNHAAAAGGVGPATRAALVAAGERPVQIEVDSAAELDEALAAGATAVLLDNFSLAEMPAAVARCRAEARPVFVETSGGITLSAARAVAETGVDAIAVGALTHSAPALDLGLDLK